jgi:hypothetical protein
LKLELRQTKVDAMPDRRLPSVDELAALVRGRRESPGETPAAERLRNAIEIGYQLADIGDALVERFVSEARAAGLSWTEIGQQFGTSKQAAQKRYGAAGVAAGQWPGLWASAAREALNRAGERARELGHDYVGTEHLLLGLLDTADGVAAHVLVDLGVSTDGVLATSCMQAGPATQQGPECLGVMPRLKQALEHARHFADDLGHGVPNTEHLLAGMLAVRGAMALEILRRLGVRVGDLRAALAERLGVDARRLIVERPRRRRLLAKAS